MYCPNCDYLLREIERLEKELAQARQQSATATDLMMKGEALREKMFLHAILGGAYDQKEGGVPCPKK